MLMVRDRISSSTVFLGNKVVWLLKNRQRYDGMVLSELLSRCMELNLMRTEETGKIKYSLCPCPPLPQVYHSCLVLVHDSVVNVG